MKSFFKKINRYKDIHLDEERKQSIRDNLVEFIDNERIYEASRLHKTTRQEVTIWSIFKINKLKSMPILAALTIIATLTTGVSFAAEGSTPGDILYPVKVNINEEVRSTFSLGAESKAEWEVRRAERRLEELADVAVDSEVEGDVDLYASLENRFSNHLDKAEKQIARLEESGNVIAASNLATRLENSLRTHEEIVVSLQERTSDDESKEKLVEIQNQINSNLAELSVIQANLETEVRNNSEAPEVKVAAENKINAAQNFKVSVESFLDNKQSEISEDSMIKINESMDLASELIVEAEAEVEAGSYSEAFIMAGEAMNEFRSVKALAQSEIKTNIVPLRLRLHLNATSTESDQTENSTSTSNGSMRGNIKIDNNSLKSSNKLKINVKDIKVKQGLEVEANL